MMRRTLILVFILAAALPALAGKGKIVIVNRDVPGKGFNDPTPATPIGGNSGTTLGAQRMNVFLAAAEKWSVLLDTEVDILAQATFTKLSCEGDNGVLGSAGPILWRHDFAGAPRAATWYPIALVNKLSGYDTEPQMDDIVMTFNSAVDNEQCFGAMNWYYGLDNDHGDHIDLLNVVLHELAHGLGFSGNGRSPYFTGGLPSIADVFTYDRSTGRSWAQMSQEERNVSLENTGNLVWTGDHVRFAASQYLQPRLSLSVSEPANVAADYDIGTATFGAPASTAPMSGKVVRVTDAVDEDGPSATDGCSPFTNAAAIAGNIAMIDRGDCPFVQKARHAQAAGATGVIIADRELTTCLAPGMSDEDSDLTIPIVSISTTDGNALKAQLDANVEMRASLRIDRSRFGGTSNEGHMRLYAPCKEDPGSSTRHWDTVATPNLLMEPSINGDLLHGVDLTLHLMLDIGWTMPARSGRGAGRRH
jgi:hypothetical protein